MWEGMQYDIEHEAQGLHMYVHTTLPVSVRDILTRLQSLDYTTIKYNLRRYIHYYHYAI